MRSKTTLLSPLLAGAVVLTLSSSALARESLPPPALEGADPAVRELVEKLLERVAATPDDADAKAQATAYGDLGRAAFFFHDRELAEASLRNAAELDPTHFRWWYYLGTLLQEQRDLEGAGDALSRAAQLAPADMPARLRLGQVRLLEGRLEEAEQLFAEIAARDGASGVAHYGLGRIDAQRGDHPAALEHLQRAAELQPEAAEVHQQLGLSYRALGDLEAARRHLGRGATGKLRFRDPLVEELDAQFQTSAVFKGMVAEREGRLDEAIAEYRKVVESNPANVTYRRALAGALVLAGRLDEGVAEYREAVELAPSEALSHARLAKALQSRDGSTEEVLAEYQSAVDLAPDLAEARIGLAGVLAVRGRWEQAEGHLSHVLRSNPDDLQVRLRRAQMRLARGLGEEAMEDLDRVLEADPDEPEARLGRAQALVRMGDLENAERHLEEVLEGEESVSRRAIAWMELGNVSEARGDLRSAAERYEQAANLAPEHIPTQVSLARVNAGLGRTQEALAGLDLALMVGGDLPELHLERGRILAEAGRFEEAEEELRAVLAEDPAHLQATMDLAALQARRGDLVGGISLLSALLEGANDPGTRAIIAFQTAVLEQQRGRIAEAISLYEAALAAEPTMRDALFNLGIAYAQQGKLPEAQKRFESLLQLDPADVEGALALARVHTSSGDFATARGTLERAREVSPSSLSLVQALVEILVGSPDPAVRDARAAVPLGRQLVSGRPTVRNLALFAAALAASGEFRAAADIQQRALEAASAAGLSAEQQGLLERDLEQYRRDGASGAGAGG